MSISKSVRTAVYNQIHDIEYKGTTIPVFDAVVNPLVEIPTIEEAEAYILLLDQQEILAPEQNMCAEIVQSSITIKVVTKFNTANVVDREIVEDISAIVESRIRTGRSHNLSSDTIKIHKVGFPISRNVDEFGASHTALSKVLIYSITLNK